MIIQVSSSLNIYSSLSYRYDGDPALLSPGTRVIVPIGNRMTSGWVTSVDGGGTYKGRLKPVPAVVTDPHAPDPGHMGDYLAFIRSVSDLYLTSMGGLLEAALPPAKKSLTSLIIPGHPRAKDGKPSTLKDFSPAQLLKAAQAGPLHCVYKAAGKFDLPAPPPDPPDRDTPAEGEKSPHRFVVGYRRAGKYREEIHRCLENGRSVLLTVPDNLTAAFWERELADLRGNTGVDLYNSRLKAGERDALWRDYVLGHKVGVVVGGLSALLLPIPTLGTVICDRAGSSTYKRRFFSPYDVAVVSRLRAETAPVSLLDGFSAPTVWARRENSNVHMDDSRPTEGPVDAAVHMIKINTRGVPPDFVERLGAYHAAGKKTLVVLNKKEGRNFLFCGKCKKVQPCPACGGFIDADDAAAIRCRRCGLEKTEYTHCPTCRAPLTLVEDISIASVKKAVKTRIVETGITSVSSEGLKEDHLHSMLKRVHDSPVVIATPVVVNPFFAGIFDAVIYLRPESLFNLEAHDAAEKVFSLVSELKELVKSGGTVDIFSTFHFHYSLKLVNRDEEFFRRELKYREWFHLPPFCNVYRIEVKGRKSGGLRALAKALREIYGDFKEALTIKRVYLAERRAVRGVYRGILEAHTTPGAVRASGLPDKRDVTVEPTLV